MMSSPKKASAPAVYLKGAAVGAALLGLATTAWLVDKTIRYPHIHAKQLGHEAPLWIPMIVFVILCTSAAVYLFLRAARRAESGEDLIGLHNERFYRRPVQPDK